MIRRFILAFILLAVAAPSFAQSWPPRTVRFVVPFGAGSTPDVLMRVIADELGKKYAGSSFIIENKAGASGNLGTDAVAKAPPDGATLGISIGGPLAINTLLFAKLPYDPGTDIEAVSQLVTQASILAVNPSLGVNSVAELVALLKKEPGKVQLCVDRQWLTVASGDGSVGDQSGHQAGPRALPGLAGGDHFGDPRRHANGVPACDFRHATGRRGQGEDARGFDRDALDLFARRADAQGKRDRCRSRCLERA